MMVAPEGLLPRLLAEETGYIAARAGLHTLFTTVFWS